MHLKLGFIGRLQHIASFTVSSVCCSQTNVDAWLYVNMNIAEIFIFISHVNSMNSDFFRIKKKLNILHI